MKGFELMSKAKNAALIFGSVTTCLFGGLLTVYTLSPDAGSVDSEKGTKIYEVHNDEPANAAVINAVKTIKSNKKIVEACYINNNKNYKCLSPN